jgi:hypothetical protein
MFTASLTNAVSATVENARATIFLQKPSRIAQQYTFPSRAGCSVMSVNHSSLGPSAVNLRCTKSARVSTPSRPGLRRRGRGSPDMPRFRMIASTSLWLTIISCSSSNAARMRRFP